MCFFKKRKDLANAELEFITRGDAQLPSNVGKIRIIHDNNHFFYKVYGDLTNKDCKIVVEDAKVIISRDGVMSETLDNGCYDVFENKGNKTVAVSIYVFNPDLQYKIKWGMPGIPYRDPQTQLPVDFRANGIFDCFIVDPGKFMKKVIGSVKSFSIEDLQDRVLTLFVAQFRNEAVKAILDNHVDYIELQSHEAEIAEKARENISALFEEQYGFVVPVIAIDEIAINPAQRLAVEQELLSVREELKNKKDAKEIAAEVERLADKAFDREIMLRNLAAADKDKFLEVLKVLGWPEPKDVKSLGSCFCAKCGAPVDPSAEFCPVCGEQLKVKTKVCQFCGKQITNKNEYCPHCGKKLK